MFLTSWLYYCIRVELLAETKSKVCNYVEMAKLQNVHFYYNLKIYQCFVCSGVPNLYTIYMFLSNDFSVRQTVMSGVKFW